jgi:uncharacterized protein (DUF885 family)
MRRRKRSPVRRFILLIALIALVGGGWWSWRLVYGRPVNIDHFFARAMIEVALDNPELLTQLGIIDNTWLDFHSGKLTDISPAAIERDFARSEKGARILAEYPDSDLTTDQILSKKILGWFLDSQVRGGPFRYHDYPVNQLFGDQSEQIDFMVQQHRVISKQSAERYIQRLNGFAKHEDQLLESLKLREERKILPPRFVVTRVIAQLKSILEPQPKDHVLYTSFAKKLDEIKDLPASDKATLLAEAERAITDSFYPAYRKLLEYETGLEARARTTDGVWDLPDGDAYYAYRLRDQTTSNMTPEEVHAFGLSEVARITGEVEAILDPMGVPPGKIGERIMTLSHDPKYAFSDDEAGRAKIMAGYHSILDEMWDHLPEAFSLLPKQKPAIEPISDFKAATAPGAYYQPPALDGGRPGTFYVNLYKPSDTTSWGMKTLAYHEGMPGHHLQTTIAVELKGEPIFRQVIPFTAYAEGWALYSERLAWEMGFEKDPLDNLGRLQAEMFRAVRLVVDTGIHAKHWTREQAIAYMLENTGMGETEVTAEIERYIVEPGQACAYKVGMASILKLREEAKQALGNRFDIKEFHRVVTGSGAMPLEVLADQVHAWVASQKPAS